MNAFEYYRAGTPADSTAAVVSHHNAMFFAGGTTLVDLMKIDVLTPDTLVDVNSLALREIEVTDEAIVAGANVSNSQLAWHPAVRERIPALTQSILSGATTQIRNMATVAGNIVQRTRCPYFRDVHSACNRRVPHSGCDALDGFNRGHAVLGVSEHCIATHPSDMCVAAALLDAEIRTLMADGAHRTVPLNEFHLLPGDTPHLETVLDRGELITHVVFPTRPIARRSYYLKVRDRASYEFALASAAVAIQLDGGRIVEARLAIGGVATKPWRCVAAEQSLVGKPAVERSFREAAEIALTGAVAHHHNAFKIELAKRTIVRAFTTITEVTA
jgi:xanthine dehydrogenase YagS FAD-binding subunit